MPLRKKKHQESKRRKEETNKQTSKLLSNVCPGSLQTKAFNSQDFSLTTAVVRTFGHNIKVYLFVRLTSD